MYIYLITNLINNKKYVGQTINDFSIRFRQHKNTHKYYSCQKTLSPVDRAIGKYGDENFKYEIIYVTDSLEDLNEKEIYYIDYYKTHVSCGGYNIKYGGDNGGKHDESTKFKIGDAQKGCKNHMFGKYGELNSTSKPLIDIYTGEYFESASLCASSMGKNWSKICACARGERISTNGRCFRYVDDNGNIINRIAKVDFPVICLDTNKVYECTADAEYELNGKVTGRLAACVNVGYKYCKLKFEKLC